MHYGTIPRAQDKISNAPKISPYQKPYLINLNILNVLVSPVTNDITSHDSSVFFDLVVDGDVVVYRFFVGVIF